MNDNSKKCPYCVELIEINSIKCKHCGEILENLKDVNKIRQQKRILKTAHETPINPETRKIKILKDEKKSNKNLNKSKRQSLNSSKLFWILATFILVTALSFVVLKYFLKPNFSDPKKVIQQTEKLWRKGDFKTYYKYLSENTKLTYESFEDYLKIRSIPDSTIKILEPISISITETKMDGYKEFKRFYIKAIDKRKDKIDTSTYYRTVFNENGKWKEVWVTEIMNKSRELLQQGDFKKSAVICNKAIKLDPFSMGARRHLAICFLRDQERPSYWEDSTVYHLNYALELDSTDGETHTIIGMYYSNINKNKKAVDNFLLAAEYFKDSSFIANSYSNASQCAKNYNISLAEKYLEKSLSYNENSQFAWQTFGDLLYNNQKYSKAKEKYLKAIELIQEDENEDNYTLISLYGQYALTCKKLGLKEEAEEYILKCIRVYPDKKHPIFKKLNL